MMDIDENNTSNVMSLTETINSVIAKGSRKTRNTKESLERFNSQVAYEEAYKESSRVCHADGSGIIPGVRVEDLSGIHKKEIIEKLKYQFYDYNLMSEIRCIVNLIIDIKDKNSESERSKIHRFIGNPKRFGEKSEYNYAMRTDLITNDDYGKKHDTFDGEMLVIKCPREPSSAKELIHELCVGVRLLELRKYGCCNFSMVYDAWYCGAPVVNDETNEVNNWCMLSNNPVSYVGYEMVNGGVPIKTIAYDKSDKVEIKTAQYLMQVALSGYLAEMICGFQHNDEHTGNLLLRPYPFVTRDSNGNVIKEEIKPFFKYYYFNGKECFIPTPGEIVTYIDYGMSRCIMEDGTSIGKLDASGGWKNSYFADPDDGNCIGDMYKLICFLLEEAYIQENDPLAIFLIKLLNNYFYRDSVIDVDIIYRALDIQRDNFYLLPLPVIREKGYNITDFVLYLNEMTMDDYNFKLLYEQAPEGASIFGFKSHFETLEEIKVAIGLGVAEIPSLYELATAVTSDSPNLEIVKNNIIKHIDEVVHNETVGINSFLNNNDPSAFFMLDPGRSNIENEIEIASRNIEDVAKIATNCYSMIEKLKVYSICKGIIDNKALYNLIFKCQRRLTRDTSYIERIKNTLMENFKHINEAMKKPRANSNDVDPLFNLSDKYEKTISALRKMNINI